MEFLIRITGSPVLGLFLLGYLFPFTNSKGAISGTVISLICLLWLFFGRFFSLMRIEHKTKPFANSYCNLMNNTELASSANVTENISSKLDFLFEKIWPNIKLLFYLLSNISFMHKLYSISYCWYSLIGLLIVLITGSIVSLLTSYI